MTERYGDRPDTPQDQPAPVITSKARTASWVFVSGNQQNACVRGGDLPAPTILFGHMSNAVTWQPPTHYLDNCSPEFQRGPIPVTEPAPTLGSNTRLSNWVTEPPTHYDRRQGSTKPDGTRDMVRPVPVSEPAPTIAAQGLAKGRDVWTSDRPATTVTGDARIAEAGHHDSHMNNAVRVSVHEAAVLQSFPADYPWQGSRTARYRQIGDAVPPLMAAAVIGAAMAPTVAREHEQAA